ncbi:spore germination protein GerPC [Rossellomorea sp. H39__3]
MNYYVQQSIQIQFIKIGGMSNSSVLQIGTCGQIATNDYLYNTGGFTEPAPQAQKNGDGRTITIRSSLRPSSTPRRIVRKSRGTERGGTMNNYYMTPQQLYQYIENLHSKIAALEKRMNDLSAELQNMRDSPSINVEKIEYKFDQLKVESLDGTLNIGLNPNSLKETIEDLAVEQNVNVKSMQDLGPDKARLAEAVGRYIKEELPVLIQDNEMQFQRSLDPQYHEMIQQDLLNQMPGRIEFYLETIPYMEGRHTKEEWEAKVLSRIKQDIQTALYTFMSQMPNNMEGMNQHEPPGNQ